jgi:hypothetical protein
MAQANERSIKRRQGLPELLLSAERSTTASRARPASNRLPPLEVRDSEPLEDFHCLSGVRIRREHL